MNSLFSRKKLLPALRHGFLPIITLFGILSPIQAQTKLIGNYAGLPRPTGPPFSTDLQISDVTVDSTNTPIVLTPAQVLRILDDGTTSVIAGVNNGCGFGGDGGPATAASLCTANGIALDSSGNLFVADLNNFRVRKITPAGTISTVAGNGASSGLTGDGGAATSAVVTPYKVAVDTSGNLFIADGIHRRIRKVSLNGIITTVAGNGTTGNGGDGGPATSAQLTFPFGIAVDAAGNLYVADSAGGRIRKIATNGIISTVAGGGVTVGDGGPAIAAQLTTPQSVSFDHDGNLLIAEGGTHSIRKVDSGGIISTIAGNGTPGPGGDGGPATSAQLYGPGSMVMDSLGNLLINAGYRLRKIDTLGIITTIAGQGTNGFGGDGGQSKLAEIDRPTRAVMDRSGNLYFADLNNFRIRKINASGIVSTIAGNGTIGSSGDNGPATAATIRSAIGIAIDAAGNLFFADPFSNRVRKIDTNGVITTYAGTGTAGYNGESGPATAQQLNNPNGVAVDSAGNVYIADTSNFRLRKVDTNGVLTTIAGFGQSVFRPNSVTVGNDGTLYVADTANKSIFRINSSGTTQIVGVRSVASSAGDDVPALTATLSDAQDIAVDNKGNLFIADGNGDRVRLITPGGMITTLAGSGTPGIGGDNGPAISAKFNLVSGVTVDTAGNIYVLDQINNSIHKADVGAVPTFSNTTAIRADFDGDGKSDILWQHNDGRVALWLMNGPGLTSGTVLQGAGTGWIAKQTGDFNGDGKADILWRHSNGSYAVWLMDGLNLLGGAVVLDSGTGWTARNIADFNGDGKADILWQHADGSIAVWLMNGLSRSDADILIGGNTGWGVKAAGDFNGDGKADLLWQHVDGTTSIWLMDGLHLTSGGGLIGAGSGWNVKAIGDLNGDGKADIIWQHLDGSVSAWLMDGLTQTGGAGWLGTGSGWSVQQVGDFNGDGKADIVWQNIDGSSAVWLMDGLNLSGGAGLLTPGTGWSSRAIADVNGDGKGDIVWQNSDGATAVWLMNGVNMIGGGGLLASGSGWTPTP